MMHSKLNKKGIILAGGTGSRLFPLTYSVPKSLLPVFNVPMINFPLALLLEHGIKDIAIIVRYGFDDMFKELIRQYRNKKYINSDVNIEIFVQAEANGIAQAYIITEEWLNGNSSVLLLGDNIFLNNINHQVFEERNAILGIPVHNISQYGVLTRYMDGIIEKPKPYQIPTCSNYAVPGIYVLDNTAPQRAKTLSPSQRNEYEITDLLNTYFDDKSVRVFLQEPYTDWYDCGTFDDLLTVQSTVKNIYKRYNTHPGCFGNE